MLQWFPQVACCDRPELADSETTEGMWLVLSDVADSRSLHISLVHITMKILLSNTSDSVTTHRGRVGSQVVCTRLLHL